MTFHKYQLGPIVGITIVALLFWHFDFDRVIAVMADIDVKYFFLATGLVLIITMTGAVSLFCLLIRDGEVSIFRFIPIFWLAWALALVTPGQIGDVISLPVLLKKFGLVVHESVGRILLDKMISLIVIAGFAVFGLLFVFETFFWSTASFVWIMLVIGAGFFLLVFRRNAILMLVDASREDWRGSIGKAIRAFVDTLRLHSWRVWVNCLLTLLKVIITGLSYWAVFAALGYSNISVIDVIPLMAISSLVAYLPISFNGLGTVEIAGVFLFATLGIPEVVVFSAYLILRSILLTAAWIPSVFVLMLKNSGVRVYD